jgi:hypothetical protein
LVSFDHCIVCPSLTYGSYLPFWYLLTIVLSVLLWLTTPNYYFGIVRPLYCLSFFDLRFLIILLVSFDHCIVCPALINGSQLPFWYLLTIVLSVLLCLTARIYPFGIFWPLYCLSCINWRLLITLLVSLTIVLSVLPWLTALIYPFGIFWPLYCLSFFDLRS